MDGGLVKQLWSNEHARCEVVKNPELPPEMDRVREVVRVWTDPEHRRQGFGTQLMQAVCEEADCERIVLILQPRPYDTGIGKDKLIAWYKRFGFVKTQDKPVLMARAPSFRVRQSMVGAAVEKVTRG
jgi:GNAT superfamily N-acetyltransferase